MGANAVGSLSINIFNEKDLIYNSEMESFLLIKLHFIFCILISSRFVLYR